MIVEASKVYYLKELYYLCNRAGLQIQTPIYFLLRLLHDNNS